MPQKVPEGYEEKKAKKKQNKQKKQQQQQQQQQDLSSKIDRSIDMICEEQGVNLF